MTKPNRIRGGLMLAHWHSVCDEHATVMAFLEWLESHYGIRLDYDDVSPDNPAPLEQSRLVDQFLGVDRAKLEQDRRNLLALHNGGNDVSG